MMTSYVDCGDAHVAEFYATLAGEIARCKFPVNFAAMTDDQAVAYALLSLSLA